MWSTVKKAYQRNWLESGLRRRRGKVSSRRWYLGTVKRIPHLPQTHRFERLKGWWWPQAGGQERMGEEAGRSAEAGSQELSWKAPILCKHGGQPGELLSTSFIPQGNWFLTSIPPAPRDSASDRTLRTYSSSGLSWNPMSNDCWDQAEHLQSRVTPWWSCRTRPKPEYRSLLSPPAVCHRLLLVPPPNPLKSVHLTVFFSVEQVYCVHREKYWSWRDWFDFCFYHDQWDQRTPPLAFLN